jgi:hypothetical protein
VETQGERIAAGCLTAVLWLLVPGLFAAAIAANILLSVFGSGTPVLIVGVVIIWLGGAVVAFWMASSKSTTSSPAYGAGLGSLFMRREAFGPLPLSEAIEVSRRYGAVQHGVRVQRFQNSYSVSQLPYLFPDEHDNLSSAENAARGLIAEYDPYGWKSM